MLPNDSLPTCPSPETLAALLAGQLSASELETLADHLSNCTTCTTLLAQIERETPGLAAAVRRDVRADADQSDSATAPWHAWDTDDQPLGSAQPADGATGSKMLGRFTILAVLGQGSFGTVYRAKDEVLDRPVALKIPRVDRLTSPDDKERFLREGRSIAQLRHPGLVTVFDVGEADGLPFLVSEFVPGTTLAERIARGPVEPREAAELLRQVADALQAAHAAGVVHRDVKPSNILLDDSSRPRLVDFGLARREGLDATMTTEGQVLGTPAYMSPEQAAGEGHRVDARSDVYRLGAVLYETLTGERPFRGNVRALLRQVLHDEPRSLRLLNDRVPRDLETITLKCLAKEPGRRYATADALAEDLRRWLAGEPIIARPIGPAGRLVRWCRRRPVAAALIVVLVGIAIVAPLVALRQARLREEAVAGLQDARDAVNQFYTRIANEKLLNEPGFQPLRKDLLTEAAANYQQFIERHGNDPDLRNDLAASYLYLGQIHFTLGEHQKALAACRQALATWQGTHFDEQRNLVARREVPVAMQNIATVLAMMNQFDEAATVCQEAIQFAETLVRVDPDFFPNRWVIADLCSTLGSSRQGQGKFNDAVPWFQRALDIRRQLLAEKPQFLNAKRALGFTLISLCTLELERGGFDSALAYGNECLGIRREILEMNRNDIFCQFELARAQSIQGRVLVALGQSEAARAIWSDARPVLERLARENSSVSDFRVQLNQLTTQINTLPGEIGTPVPLAEGVGPNTGDQETDAVKDGDR